MRRKTIQLTTQSYMPWKKKQIIIERKLNFIIELLYLKKKII